MIYNHRGCCFAGVAALMICAMPLPRASAQGETKTWRVPIVMEQSTVRGKVAILETRREDRKVLEGLDVQVWSTETAKEEPKKGWFRRKPKEQTVKKDLLHEAKTDENGIFGLPLLKPSEYFLGVGQVQFRLTVIPQDKSRKGQQEPKVLLILIPKEVIDIKRSIGE